LTVRAPRRPSLGAAYRDRRPQDSKRRLLRIVCVSWSVRPIGVPPSACRRLLRYLSSLLVCGCGGRVGCHIGRRRGADREPRDLGREPAREPFGGMDVGAGAWRVPKLLEPDRQALDRVVQAAEAIRTTRRAADRSARARACRVRGKAGPKHEHAVKELARLEREAASGCSGRWDQVQGAADVSRDACGRRDRVVRNSSAVAGDASSHESPARELVRRPEIRMPMSSFASRA
jgi:hypothetical protein